MKRGDFYFTNESIPTTVPGIKMFRDGPEFDLESEIRRLSEAVKALGEATLLMWGVLNQVSDEEMSIDHRGYDELRILFGLSNAPPENSK